MTTKQTHIENALDDIGFSGDYDAALLARGLRTLDRMVMSWLQKGIDIGYLKDDTSELTDSSGILDQFAEAVEMNLGVALAAQLSLSVDPYYRGRAASALAEIMPLSIPEMVTSPFMPLGAGNRRCYTSETPVYQTLGEKYEDIISTDSGVYIIDDSGYAIGE